MHGLPYLLPYTHAHAHAKPYYTYTHMPNHTTMHVRACIPGGMTCPHRQREEWSLYSLTRASPRAGQREEWSLQRVLLQFEQNAFFQSLDSRALRLEVCRFMVRP